MLANVELRQAPLGAAPWELCLQEQDLLKIKKFARVFSPTNIALAKYWGKRDVALNLPTNGSLSATLAGLGSFTTVLWSDSFSEDVFILNGVRVLGGKSQKIVHVLDLLRGIEPKNSNLKAFVCSENNFPTAAGLASSASGFSALTLAASTALDLNLPLTKLSEIARRGSGSACRSFAGGFVEWAKGNLDDGSDSIAQQISPEENLPLDAHILVVQAQEKSVASTGGMESTRLTSPYFTAWVESAQKSVADIRRHILAKNFLGLAQEVEANCLRFHSSAIAANPGIIYWRGETLECIHAVRDWREKERLDVFFTIDAGPNVVVFCTKEASPEVQSRLNHFIDASHVQGSMKLLSTRVGPGAEILLKSEQGRT